jgi:phosphoribosylaminoimidazolecarboxamide formyltransferase/IMP cyclohydrolase
MIKIKRALLSVSDKRGIEELAKSLKEFNVEIISTGGTAKVLKNAGIKVTEVSEITKFPEMMDGRVKTLHPAIHAALLARRDNPSHLKQIEEQNINLIDMVVVNLYPFAKTIAQENVTLEEAIENIDIGGPSMIRSAAKNFEGVVVVVNPERYSEIVKEMEKNNGCISENTRKKLAIEAFKHTAEYDRMIYEYLSKVLG